MEELLLEVPDQEPLWITAKLRHRIRCEYDQDTDTVLAVWENAEGYRNTFEGDTEREAVISLIHALKLTGWQSLSINP